CNGKRPETRASGRREAWREQGADGVARRRGPSTRWRGMRGLPRWGSAERMQGDHDPATCVDGVHLNAAGHAAGSASADTRCRFMPLPRIQLEQYVLVSASDA